MPRRLATAILAVTLIGGSPALAAESPADQALVGLSAASAASIALTSTWQSPGYPLAQWTPASPKSPWLAVGLSVGLPVALYVSSSLITQTPARPLGYVLAIGILPAFGAGQAYAGDWKRAGWVALGLPAAALAGFLVGAVVAGAASLATGSSGESAGITFAVIGGTITAATSVGYIVWDGMDAYHTAEKANDALAQGTVKP